MLPPAQTVAIPTTTADVTIIGGAMLLRGWSFVETTASAGAAFALYDGVDENGQLVATITLASNESTRDYPSGAGIEIHGGLFLKMLSGSIQGAVWITPATRYGEYELLFGERDAYVGEV